MTVALKRLITMTLPVPIRAWLRASWQDREYCPPVGSIRFGDLRRLTPVSRCWGYDRGLPIDRYYIEKFLLQYSTDIRGRVMEIGDDTYTQKFGGRVTRSDVLHVLDGNPKATIVGDLTQADHIDSNSFDCIICTQTLHLIYDTRAAIKTLYRILQPGGILLATFPGITPISHSDWPEYWCWSFTTHSARLLFGEVFPPRSVRIDTYGNVLAATAFLQGLAVAELRKEELESRDPDYEVTITVRATKPE